ncbi:Nucleoside-diphosphate-sugar epimerase [Reichenbachiella faecimaris]|uniref:Nucleoside-diphosphate-sugar epimerase n=2 Tax=Reichenbachiella faecimaris TaxID=692418 RepID=A0A1W2GCL1_REIFA|nr:Nucleoside-diphosphate-sugar epimerase [Reichenbachiella faecimaris]
MAGHSNILIIGIDSFTGNHLKAHFEEKGWQVFGTSFSIEDTDKVFKVDIIDSKAVIAILRKVKPDYIINLAAISFVGEPNHELFYKVNVLGAESLLESICKSGIEPKKVLMPSSAVVYGNQNEVSLHEGLIPNPINHYGYSKYVGEQICKTYFDKLNIIVPRPFNYTGEGQLSTFLVPKIVDAYKKGCDRIALGNLDTFREFNDVKLICWVYEKLLIVDKHSEIVNVCSGNTHSVRQIIDKMQLISDNHIYVDVDKRFVRKNEIQELKGSPKKLESLIGKLDQTFSLELLLERLYKS